MNFVQAMIFCLAALALCSVAGPAFAHAQKNPASQPAGKAVKKQASVFDIDGYRVVSPTMRCAQTLRGALHCKE